MAGLETGRRTRFGLGVAREQQIKEEERKERAYRDALVHLLATDPEYRELYEELGQKLAKAETQADQAIAEIEAELANQQSANQDMRDRAPKIAGKAVFRYADGRVVDEDGNEIDPALAAGIIWPEDAFGAEDYFYGITRENELRAILDEWRTYRYGTLGDIRNRYGDGDDPMTKEDLRDLIETIEAKAPDLPIEAAKPTDTVNTVSGPPQALLTLDG